MKHLSVLLIALSFSWMTSQAQASTDVQGGNGNAPGIFSNAPEVMSLPDFAERLATPGDDPAMQTYTCRAWTTCPGGYRISCWSRGYRCYSEAIPGYRVYCSATSRSGYTEYWYAYCY